MLADAVIQGVVDHTDAYLAAASAIIVALIGTATFWIARKLEDSHSIAVESRQMLSAHNAGSIAATGELTQIVRQGFEQNAVDHSRLADATTLIGTRADEAHDLASTTHDLIADHIAAEGPVLGQIAQSLPKQTTPAKKPPAKKTQAH